jgi:secreted trypsin-like serine protease
MAAFCLFSAPVAGAQTPEPRIVGGSNASISTYPWQAGVVFSQRFSGNPAQRQFCGGSLLTSRIVITAGHCVWDSDPDYAGCFFCPPVSELHLDPNDVDAVLGRTTLSDTSQGAEHAVIGVYWDPNFQMSTGPSPGVPTYDVAFLVLGSASDQTQIKIAGPDEGDLWDPGSPADISGWGATSNGGNHVNDLRAATVSIVADSTCAANYPGWFNVGTMLCAGGNGADTCQGDSGGPLEAPLTGGGYRLVGITSWGLGCGQAPGVYTRVAGPTMSSRIQADVSNLEGAFGLPGEGIFGSRAQPADATPPAAKSAKTTNPLKKCKRIHDKRKRHRCIKRVKRKLKSKHH